MSLRGRPRHWTPFADRHANDARALARTEPKGQPGRPRADGTQACGPRPGHQRARALKNARYALWKNPDNLTDRQRAKLDWIAATDPLLHRAYLLKEGLRTVFAIGHSDGPDAGIEALEAWLSWAARCRIPTFIDLGHKIRVPDPRRIRIPLRRSPDRLSHAQPRRLPTRTPRPHIAHGYVSRVTNRPLPSGERHCRCGVAQEAVAERSTIHRSDGPYGRVTHDDPYRQS